MWRCSSGRVLAATRSSALRSAPRSRRNIPVGRKHPGEGLGRQPSTPRCRGCRAQIHQPIDRLGRRRTSAMDRPPDPKWGTHPDDTPDTKRRSGFPSARPSPSPPLQKRPHRGSATPHTGHRYTKTTHCRQRETGDAAPTAEAYAGARLPPWTRSRARSEQQGLRPMIARSTARTPKRLPNLKVAILSVASPTGYLQQRRPRRSTLPTLLVWNKQPPQPRRHDCRFPGRRGRLDPRDPIAPHRWRAPRRVASSLTDAGC